MENDGKLQEMTGNEGLLACVFGIRAYLIDFATDDCDNHYSYNLAPAAFELFFGSMLSYSFWFLPLNQGFVHILLSSVI